MRAGRGSRTGGCRYSLPVPAAELTSAVPLPNPRLRGWLHQIAFIVAVPAAVTLIVLAPTDRARAAAAVFASGRSTSRSDGSGS